MRKKLSARLRRERRAKQRTTNRPLALIAAHKRRTRKCPRTAHRNGAAKYRVRSYFRRARQS